MRELLFGCCPQCGEFDGYMNIDEKSWLYCDKHKIAWYAGSYVSREACLENPTIWERNKARLAEYTHIAPAQAVFDDEQQKIDALANELLAWLELDGVSKTEPQAQPGTDQLRLFGGER